jgi:tyrosine-protein kinase Etk/Wzc
VLNPRQASIKLRNRLVVGFPDTSFLSVRLTGPHPVHDAAIINAIGRQFVGTAAKLTSGSQSQSAQQLEAQLSQAETALRSSEEALSSYRTGTVGLPSQDATTGARDPSFDALYDQRTQLDNIRADRQALQRVLSSRSSQGIDAAALLAIPSVREAPELTGALADLTKAESNLQALRRTYTDEYRAVTDARAEVDRIKQQTLPSLARGVLDRLQARENALSSRVAAANGALRSVPGRTIDEQRLERDVQMNASVYTALRSQYDGARLSEIAAVPGIAVLDSAVAPLEPVTNTVPGILLASLLAGVALAIALALLLDAADHRLWYPEQVEALGYEIVGAVPRGGGGGRNGLGDPVAAAQVNESIRALRLNVLNAVLGKRPVVVSVLSAEVGDGKSFISSELARCFAQAGQRTVLVDADVRRGTADQTFAVARTPGLTDYLAGHVPLDAVIRPTAQKNLDVVASGTRLVEGPELIGSPALPSALGAISARYEVVIVDTPPLGAGADAAALATATGNAMLVIRAGKTDRKAAKARLAFIERLPVQMLGVVLNAIRAEGMFAAYSYLPEYAVYAPDSYDAGVSVEAERPLTVAREPESADLPVPSAVARDSADARPANQL